MGTPTFPLLLFLVAAAITAQHSSCAAFTPTQPCTLRTPPKTSVASPTTTAIGATTTSSDKPNKKRILTEISPLKASMLTKNWQSLLAEVDQKVGIVPELGSTSVGIQRFGPELERRTKCKRQFEFFHASTFGLALADKAEDEARKEVLRGELPGLEIGGAKRGLGCRVFACVTSPATMCLVECESGDGDGDDDDADRWWSVLAMIVNPTERSLPVVIASERGALDELRALAKLAKLRVEASVVATLAGSHADLGLGPDAEGETWLIADAGEV